MDYLGLLSQEIKLVQKCGAASNYELMVDNEGHLAFRVHLRSFDTLCNGHSHYGRLVEVIWIIQCSGAYLLLGFSL